MVSLKGQGKVLFYNQLLWPKGLDVFIKPRRDSNSQTNPDHISDGVEFIFPRIGGGYVGSLTFYIISFLFVTKSILYMRTIRLE